MTAEPSRIASTSLSGILAGAAPVLAAGAVNIISVEAIRERSGERWARKRDQVGVFLIRTFRRSSGQGALIVALNDVEFLTIQPDASQAAAVNFSATILKETLCFFLGAAAQEDMRLLHVTAFADGKLEVVALDPGRLYKGDDATQPGDPQIAESSRAPPCDGLEGLGPARTATLVATRGGKAFEIEAQLEPVWNIGAGVVTSFLLSTTAFEATADGERRPVTPEDMTPALAGSMAIQALNYAVDSTRHVEGGGQVAIHAPLPLPALTFSTSRYELLHALRDLDPMVRRRLVLEITELPEGFPAGRLTELVSMLSPLGRAVLARASAASPAVRTWRDCRLNGITLDCAGLDVADRRVPARLSAFSEAAGAVAPHCIGYGLESRSLLLAGWGAGFSHRAGRALSAVVNAPRAVRLTPEDFYAAISRGQSLERSAA